MHRGRVAIALKLLALTGPLVPFLLLAIILGVLGFLAAIGIVVFGGYAVLNAADMVDVPGIKTCFAVIAGCAVLRGAFRYGEQLCGHYIAFKLLAVIRDKVFGALRRLAPAKLESRDKGHLISIITSDIEPFEVFYAHTIAPVVIAVVISSVMIVFIGQYSYELAAIAALAYLTVGLLIPAAASRLDRGHGKVYKRRFGELSSYFLDSLRGMKESIQYGCGEKRLDVVDRMSDELDAEFKGLKRHEGAVKAATDTAVIGFSFSILLAGLSLLSAGRIGIDGVVISTMVLFSSFGPVVSLSNLSNSLLLTFASAGRVLDLLDEPEQTAEVTEGTDVSFAGASCREVTFGYGKEPVVEDVNLTVAPGQIVGITGKSGSGKSTLLKLLMRFWDVDEGRICISNEDIRKLNTENLRSLQSYVTQDTFLFNDTIEANIKIGRPDATREQVAEAAKKASVYEFIQSLPQGFETAVGELGDRLSGGERQRIGLARAFLHDALLVLLDEPTSNLDALNEALILKSLKEESKHRTIVLVSHRSSTLRIADEFYHMADGRIS